MQEFNSYPEIIAHYQEQQAKEQKDRETIMGLAETLLAESPEGMKMRALIKEIVYQTDEAHDFVLGVLWTMIDKNQVQFSSDSTLKSRQLTT